MSANVQTTYQLYFGRIIDLPQFGHEFQTKVSDREFNDFIKDHVIPEFESFAITQGIGYWRGNKEEVTIVTIISDQYDDAVLIHNIAEAYKRRFEQEAVLVNTFSCFPNLV